MPCAFLDAQEPYLRETDLRKAPVLLNYTYFGQLRGRNLKVRMSAVYERKNSP